MAEEKPNFSIKLFYSLFFYSFFVETLTVFGILFIFLSSQYYLKDQFVSGVFKEIFGRALNLSIIYVLILKLLGLVYTSLRKMYSGIIPYEAEKPRTLLNSLVIVLLGITLILTTGPIRPILKIEDNIPMFNTITFSSDALATFFILSFIAIPVIIVNLRTNRGVFKYVFISLMIDLILLAGYINNKPYSGTSFYEKSKNKISSNLKRQGLDMREFLKGSDQRQAVFYYWFGTVETALGNRQQGNNYLMKSIALDPTYGPPYSAISLSFTHYGEYETARIIAEKCIEYAPDYAWCYYAMGKSYDLSNQKYEADKFYRLTIKLDPDTPDFQNTFKEFIYNNPHFEK